MPNELLDEIKVTTTAGAKLMFRLTREGQQTEIRRTITLPDGSQYADSVTLKQLQLDAQQLSDIANHLKYLLDAKIS